MVLIAAAVSACAAAGQAGRPTSLTPETPQPTAMSNPDPQTSAALIAIAQRFNDDYGRNNDGPVYDRWDARSQALISRGDYIRRHSECPSAQQGPTHVLNALPGPGGSWLVRYEIDGMPFTDYWFYSDGRWAFDIILSNPASARLYRLSFSAYATAVGCAHR